MSREERTTQKHFKIFCEGETEYNYFDSFRKENKLSITLKPVNMHGGGYANFLSQIKIEGNTNCLAKFIIIDGDKAFSNECEKKNLRTLFEYCDNQNKRGRIPHVLILNYPDFEYVASLHCPDFNSQNIERFLTRKFKLTCIDDLKAEKEIFKLLNSKGNSYNVLLRKSPLLLKIVQNEVNVKKEKYLIKIKARCDLNNLGRKATNIEEFFDVFRKFELIP